MAGTQAGGKHIMIILRARQKRSHKGSVMERKVSEQHVFEVAFTCKEQKGRWGLYCERLEGAWVFGWLWGGFLHAAPVKLSKHNHTSFHLQFILPKAAYLDHTVTMFFLGDAQEIANSGFETQLRGINKHAALGLLADIKLVREISRVFYPGWGPESQMAGHETAEQGKKMRRAVRTSQQTRISIGTDFHRFQKPSMVAW